MLGLACLLGARGIGAQERGFAIDRHRPAAPGNAWFSADSLDLVGHNRWAAGALFDWAYQPLVTQDVVDGQQRALIENRQLLNLGVAVNLFSRLRLGLAFPLLLVQNGERAGVAEHIARPDTAPALGDVRLAFDAALLSAGGGAAVLAVGGQVFLPTGYRAGYLSDGSVRIAPHFTLAGHAGALRYSVHGGVMLRQDHTVADSTWTADVEWSAALGAALLEDHLLLGPELWAVLPTANATEAAFDETSPVLEGLIGAHVRSNSVHVGFGLGTGFSPAVGSPDVRVVSNIEWVMPIEGPPKDRDRDGVPDARDGCPDIPDVPGQPPLSIDLPGCPRAQADADSDGVADNVDACREVRGFTSRDRAANGCPLDSDLDGVNDPDDACPLLAGKPNLLPSQRGCPPPAAELVSVKEISGCSDPRDPFAARNGGCLDAPATPMVRITRERVMILDRIDFEANATIFARGSELVLAAIRDALVQNPQLMRVVVEGHTDNRGVAETNLELSQARAQAVVNWLVDHGIHAQRLSAVGYGALHPLVSNETEDGRRTNRRVEFRVVESPVEARY
jgi:OmpA-OmpF porin, OOP family